MLLHLIAGEFSTLGNDVLDIGRALVDLVQDIINVGTPGNSPTAAANTPSADAPPAIASHRSRPMRGRHWVCVTKRDRAEDARAGSGEFFDFGG